VSAFGRGGLVVSLMAVAVQVTSSGGLYPIEALATPYQLISPLMPLTYAVSGMQGILAGAPAASVMGSAIALLGFGLLSALVSFALIGRTRRMAAIQFA
jgi:putative membrane protein